MIDPTHDEIVEQHRRLLNTLANTLDEVFNPDPSIEKEVCFVLLMAPFGDAAKDGRVNYISNGDRADCITMMKEIVARFEGRYSQEEGRA